MKTMLSVGLADLFAFLVLELCLTCVLWWHGLPSGQTEFMKFGSNVKGQTRHLTVTDSES